MDKIVAFYNDLPQTAQIVLAGLGAVIIVSKLVTAFQAFLGIFILTGDSVRTPNPRPDLPPTHN